MDAAWCCVLWLAMGGVAHVAQVLTPEAVKEHAGAPTHPPSRMRSTIRDGAVALLALGAAGATAARRPALFTATTPQAVTSALTNLSLALLASSTADTPAARASLRAELQCVDDSGTPARAGSRAAVAAEDI